MKLLDGKRVLVTGVANRWTIATGIARKLHEHGAQIALTYQGDRVKDEVEKLAAELGGAPAFACDVSDDASLAAMREALLERFGKLDALVHSIAFANKEDLAGKVFDTSRGGFALALDISSYSLIALVQALRDAFNDNASIMALTYLGATQIVPNYNFTGIAKAALEAIDPLPRVRPRRPRDPRQRDLGRADQDRELAPSRRLLADARRRTEGRAAAPQRHAGRRRQHGGLSRLRSRERSHGRRALRRRRLSRDGHVRSC